MDQPDRLDLSSEPGVPALRVVSANDDPAEEAPGDSLLAGGEQFRALVANIPGVVYRCACDEEWTMRFFSDHIEQLIGYPADDFIGNRRRTYGSLIHPEDRQSVVAAIEAALDRAIRTRCSTA